MTHPDPPETSRRGFLAMIAGLSTLVLQACGFATDPEPATPTRGATATSAPGVTSPPGSTATSLPVPSPTGASIALGTTPTPDDAVRFPLITTSENTPTPTPSATPTASPVPPPSATPAPTWTPVPPATPFPPGPQTKLGLFIGFQHPKLLELIETGNVPLVKTLEYDANLMEFIKQRSPNTILIARFTPLGQLNLGVGEPRAEARRFVDLLLPIATEPRRLANIDAWEAYNEPSVKSPEHMAWLAEFEAERTRRLAAAGVRSCIGNFATGEPELELWPAFYPALQAAKETGGYLGLHEYSAPYMWFGSGPYQLEPGQDEGDEGWLTLRYRKVYRDYLRPAGLDVPLLLTEIGIDGQVQGRPGPRGLGWLDFVDFWKAEGRVRTTPAGFYMEQLAWYDAELQQDDYVRGGAIFALAGPRGWESFEINGQVADLLHQYVSVHPRR